MPDKKVDVKVLWIQFEDVLTPALGLTIKERAVYCHLLRHSLVVGKQRLRFAVTAMARTLSIGPGAARDAVRRLDELGALRVLERGKGGHFIEMRLPEKMRAARPSKNASAGLAGAGTAEDQAAATLEATDFWKSWSLRKAIHAREGGTCFYCLRRMLANVRCIE